MNTHQQQLGTIQNNSRESIEGDEIIAELANTEGNINEQKTPAKEAEEGGGGLNTSIFLHSKLGLLDNQVTVNYDLTMPT